MKFKVESVNISKKKGVEKHSVDKVECISGHGIKGDAHAGNWHRQVSFLANEAVKKMKEKIRTKGENLELKPGIFAENILTSGIDWSKVNVGGRIFINKNVVLEVTQIGKECHTGCVIYKLVGDCIMPKQGIFTKVINGGIIRAGDSGYYSIR